MENKYLKAIESIIEKDSPREWMRNPVNAFNKTMGVTSQTLIATPLVGTFENREKEISMVYPVDENVELTIDVEDLKSKLETIEKVKTYENSIIEVKCEACDGLGTVEFIFEWDLETYEITEDCPVCEGTGYVENVIEKESGEDYNPEKVIKIGCSIFKPSKILTLIRVAEILSEKTIKLYHQTMEHQKSAFKIGEVDLILMPSIDYRSKIIAEYKIK